MTDKFSAFAFPLLADVILLDDTVWLVVSYLSEFSDASISKLL